MPDLKEELYARQHRACQMIQARHDAVLKQVGARAPAPIMGQSPEDYKRENLRFMKRSYLANHPLYKINMRGLPDDALPQFETQVLNAVPAEEYNPLNVPIGEIKQIDVLDEGGRLMRRDFVGQECFVKDMGRPGRRVVRFTQLSDPSNRAINEHAHAGPSAPLMSNAQLVHTTGDVQTMNYRLR